MEVKAIEDGYIHLQSEHSLRRASMSLQEMFQRAKVLGVKKLVLTEYQTMASCIEAYDLMREYEIPVSVGTEINVHWREKRELLKGTLLLIPTDQKGYGIIGKVLSESQIDDGGNFIREETLKKWIAPGTCGHGHVMVTTGGADGMLYRILRRIPEAEERLRTVKQKQRKITTQSGNAPEKAGKKAEDIRKETKLQKQHRRMSELNQEESALKKMLQQKEQMAAQAALLCHHLAELAGEEYFFVELVTHGIRYEKEMLLSVVQAAGTYQLLSATEAWYAGKSREEKRRQELMTESGHEKQTGFSGDYAMRPIEEMQKQLGKLLPDEVLARCEEGRKKCCAMSEVFALPSGTHYPVFPGEDGTIRLRRLTEQKRSERYPKNRGWTGKHEKRLREELDVIIQMGFADYFCIVEDLVCFIHQLEQETPGKAYYLGPGRGSAVGSLVSYILGITAIDPMEEQLLFSRFLNPMRISAPDIDLDIAPQIYGKVMQYMKQKYGEYALCAISTKMRYGALQALEYAGNKNDASAQMIEGMKKMLYVDGESLKDSQKLKAFAKKNKKAASVLADAMLLEGRRSGIGQHPSGLLFSDAVNISNRTPLVYNERTGQWMTQFDMGEVERFGLLKLDLLNLRTLDIVTETLRTVEESVDLEHLPMLEEVFSEIFCKGKTVGVFQLESEGMRRLLRKFQPVNLQELTLLISMYRPGPIQYADLMLKAKREGKGKHYGCEKLDRILKDTYGYPVYQEELMCIFHEIGGLSLAEADMVRRGIAKKDAAFLEPYRTRLLEGLLREGMAKERAKQFWEELLAFGKYAFNRSHAAAYAKLAYLTAYLKYCHTRVYLCALCNYSPKERIPVLVAECRRNGITVLPPDILVSKERFTLEKSDVVRFGLGGIKGMTKGALRSIQRAREQKPFVSMKDFLIRGFTDHKTTELLILSGAMDRWTNNRKELLEWYQKAYAYLQAWNRETAQQRDGIKAEIQKQRFLTSIQNPASKPWATAQLEAYERQVLGCSFHSCLTEQYANAFQRYPGIKRIAERLPGENLLYGQIREVRILQRKKDGKPFALFLFVDEETEIEAVCFADTYEKWKEQLSDREVCAIRGRVATPEEENLEAEKLIVREIHPIRTSAGFFDISIPAVTEAKLLTRLLRDCRMDGGAKVFLHDRLTGQSYKVPFEVSEEIYRIPWNQEYFLFHREMQRSTLKREITAVEDLSLEQAA